jgi:uncharacterized protein (DUF2062 family)
MTEWATWADWQKTMYCVGLFAGAIFISAILFSIYRDVRATRQRRARTAEVYGRLVDDIKRRRRNC